MLLADRILSALRDARWLDGVRVRGYSLLLLVISALGFAGWIMLSHGLIDHTGKPLGTDFMSFYAASRLTLDGHAAAAWSPDAHHAAENAILGRDLGDWAFFYPPAYLLICAPLALMPYAVALCVWLGATTAAAAALIRRWLRTCGAPVVAPVLIAILAFPAFWINIGNGQNAALMTAIFVGGCLLLPRRPLLAGLVFGLLVMKPQLGLALPFLLAASGRWKTFAATGLSVALLCAAAFALVGVEGYLAFFHNAGLARSTLEHGLVSPAKMVSLFAALKLWGAPNALAYAGQGLLAVAAIIVSAWITIRHRPDTYAFSALLAITTLLISPFLLDYDLLLLAIPLGWLVMTGLRDGFRPWEKLIALAIYILPLFARNLALNLHLPLTPLLLTALLVMIGRRTARPAVA